MKLTLSLLPAYGIALMTFFGPHVLVVEAQEAPDSTPAPNLSGTGNAGRIAVWKSTTALGSSALSQSSGNVGIGTTAPAAKLEVNGDAQVDGNFTLSGNILLSGSGPLIRTDIDGNFAAGLNALPSTLISSANTAVGTNALSSYVGTGPTSNTAVGFSALFSDTTGGFNTALGTQALFVNTTGSENIAIGTQALQSNTTGSGNVAIGGLFAALGDNITGSNNLAIGGGAGLISGNNNIYLVAAAGSADESGAIRIGTAGIQTAAFIAGIQNSNISGAVVVVSPTTGQLGISSSSRRYKENIQDMRDASSGLMHLRPVTFRYKKAFDDGSKPVQYGLVAEEVADVYPDLVTRSADGQVESVKYQLLDSMLLNELQKQNTTIATQKEQIRSLEERLAKIEAALHGTVAPTRP